MGERYIGCVSRGMTDELAGTVQGRSWYSARNDAGFCNAHRFGADKDNGGFASSKARPEMRTSSTGARAIASYART